MRIPGAYRSRQLARRTRALFQARALVLLYHRVAEPPADPQLLCVALRRFAEQMEHLQRHYRVLSAAELAEALEAGRLPRRSVLITFDDAYVDNLHAAAPVLERLRLPATVFATTGSLERGAVFWWDELEWVLLQAPDLPDPVVVTVNGVPHRWSLGAAAHFPPEMQRRYHGWSVAAPDDPTPRHRAYRELHRLLRPLSPRQRDDAVSQLRDQARPAARPPPDGRGMTRAELRQLVSSGWVAVGAHTVHHPQLSAQPRESQEFEVGASKQHLEELLGRPVTTFAYPYGDAASVGTETVAAVRAAGYRLAFANVAAPTTRGADRFRVPRYLVRNWSGDEFAGRLRAWFCE